MIQQRSMALADVRATHKCIKSLVYATPILTSDILSRAASAPDLRIKLFFKCENLQKSGSFKFRGASNFIANQSNADLQKGIVATSTGNFGLAVAFAAKIAAESRSIPINASVVLPETSPPSKIYGAKENGAEVFLAGTTPKEREHATRRILDKTGAIFVGPMDDPLIVLGQATATLEFMEQITETSGEKLDALVLPSATGGLLAGAAVVCEKTDTIVFGCEPREGGPDLRHGVEAGVVSNPQTQNSIADGLRASTSVGNFEMIRQNNLVHGIYAADDGEIRRAWRLLIEQLRLLVEPTSALALALILYNEEFRTMLAQRKSHWNIGLVLTGGNTTISRIVEEFGQTMPETL